MKNTFILLFLLPAFCYSAATTPTVQPGLTTRDGLSQGYVETMVQDSLGYMWFATPDGLNRYDGHSFKIYRHTPGDTQSKPAGLVTRMTSASAGDLWLATSRNELWYYHAAKDSFSLAPLPEALQIRDIAPGHSGSRLLLISQKDLYYAERHQGKLRYTHTALPQPATPGSRLQKGKDGTIYFLTQKEVYTSHLPDSKMASGLLTNKWELMRRPHTTEPATYVYQPGSGEQWVAGRTSMLIRKDGRYREISFPTSPELSERKSGVTNIMTDHAGNVWILLNRSLIRIKAHHLPHLQPEHLVYQPQFGLVNSLYQDRSGLIWTSLNGRGLATMSPLQQAFRHTHSGKVIYYILEDSRGNVWTQHDLPRTYDSLAVRQRIPMAEDDAGRIWIRTGAANGRERKYSAFEQINDKGEIVKTIEVPSSVSNHPYPTNYVLYKSRKGLLWMISGNELISLDPVSYNLRTYPFIRKFNNTPETSISAIEETATGQFIIATAWGLAVFDPATGAFHMMKGKPGATSNIISLATVPGAQDYLWAGTRGDGLYYINLTSEKIVQHYHSGHYLKDNVIYGILYDHTGYLWLSGNTGLTRFHPGTKAITQYSTRDGLQSDEFNTFSYHQGASGKLYFGGMNGLNAFYPHQISKNNTPPEIQIGEIRVNGKSLPRAQVSSGERISLPHDHNTLSFQYAALDFHNPSKNQYRIKLEGATSDWLNMGNRTYTTFANLAPGSYTLRVKGSNNSGIWSPREARISFVIRSPWYATPWAYAAYTLAALAIISGYIHLRTRKIQLAQKLRLEEEEARQLKELDTLKSNFVANIVHEFRTPVTLMLSPLEQVMESLGDQHRQELQLSHRSGRKVLLLVNRLLDLAKLESGSMEVNRSHGDICQFIRRILQSFQAQATRQQIRLTSHYDLPAPECLFDPDKTEAIITNLLSNALKYTSSGGRVALTLSAQNKALHITVSDTGSGIPTEAQPFIFDRFYQGSTFQPGGTGIGLALCKELTELLGGEITCTSQPGKGSTFTVTLPLHRQAHGQSRTPYTATGTACAPYEPPYLPGPVMQPESTTEILIIEDNDDLRHYLEHLLATQFRVTVAADGQKGLELARSLLPDIILTDLMMPGLSGTELCYQLKQDRLTSHIPVIMLTAKTALDSKLQSLEAGAEVYLTKPFNLKELQLRIQNALDLRANLKSYFATSARESQPEKAPAGISPLDVQFMQDMDRLIHHYIEDPQLSTQTLVQEMGISKSQLYRKLKALTGMSVNHYIRSLRLQKSCQLLIHQPLSLKEITFTCGFSSQSYFTRSFKEAYGCTPGEYRQQNVHPAQSSS
ncbi:ATP-binding protein [Roseivirga sp. BDSF3-8]|uniref:ATP-binding protein n=1 Tax=Roseivirga sp. BDSF3-8 TaxID=3241598 RepID=UPI003532419D